MIRISLSHIFLSGWLLFRCGAVCAEPAQASPTSAQNLVEAAANAPVPYAPDSLGYLVWTNFIAHTNGRTSQIWSRYELPTNFPVGFVPGKDLPARTKPVLEWSTNCLMWGMKGETALSQCWTSQGSRGQAPITALTRRHGYTRGHGAGAAGMTPSRNGQRIYFCTTNNEVVEVIVQNTIIQIGKGWDYALLLFDRDLPPGIEPLRVVDMKLLFEKYPPDIPGKWVAFMTEQGGNVSAYCPPFLLNVMKGGDSGSPNLLPLPRELVFYSGRTTSGPSEQMQKDLDELSRSAGLDPAKYQLQWLDLSAFPTPKPSR